MKISCLCIGVVFGLSCFTMGWEPVQADLEVSQKPQKILFIGNSYTSRNHLVSIVRRLAASDKPPVTLTTERHTHGGITLQIHCADPNTFQLIKKKQWDYVVMQEYSTRPVREKEKFYEYARKLGTFVESQGSKPVFYMTWARQNRPEMIGPLEEAYTQMGRELDSFVAPVGLAWAAWLKDNSDIPLHVEDKSHPNVFGTYLTGCVFYATLTGRSPVGLSNAGVEEISPELAEKLQKTAWKTVCDYAQKQADAEKADTEKQ